MRTKRPSPHDDLRPQPSLWLYDDDHAHPYHDEAPSGMATVRVHCPPAPRSTARPKNSR